MALNSKEAIEILEEIESVTTDLIALKDYLLTVDSTIDELNEKNRGLLESNNTLYRQIGHQIIVNERRNKNGFKLKRSN